MIAAKCREFLLDIEGTTSSVSYVYDVMFPFARRELESYLTGHWDEPQLDEACDLIAQDAGYDDFTHWRSANDAVDPQHLIRDEITRLMDNDLKATGLKQLQGLIWRAGFESGELQAHLYDDVPAALKAWKAAGREICIYSSGSIGAQKLFFGHTIVGDLLDQFAAHFDTTSGPKREAESYRQISRDRDCPPADVLFLSDVVEELDAARDAGMQTGLVRRPGNAPVADENGHDSIDSFAQIELA